MRKIITTLEELLENTDIQMKLLLKAIMYELYSEDLLCKQNFNRLVQNYKKE